LVLRTKNDDLFGKQQERWSQITEQGKGGLIDDDKMVIFAPMYVRPTDSIICQELLIKCVANRKMAEKVWGNVIRGKVLK
jgi:hypothetical protein